MASADFLTRIPTPHDVSSTVAHVRISPGMTHPPSRLYLSDIRRSVPCKFRALTILAALPRCDASYPLPVRQASALPSASSRFAVTRGTLAVRLTLPLAGRVEDFHLQVSAPCRAHQNKSASQTLRGAFIKPLHQAGFTQSELRVFYACYFYAGNIRPSCNNASAWKIPAGPLCR